MQDTFNVSDVWNRISLLDTTPAMEALAEQVEKLDKDYGTSLRNTQAYSNLLQQIKHAKNEISKYPLKPGGADANKEEALAFDIAIKDMVEEISKVLE